MKKPKVKKVFLIDASPPELLKKKPPPPEQEGRHPLVPTERPNGGVRKRYYAYLFHPNPDVSDPHLSGVGQSLQGPHQNIGDLWLKIASKLVGVPGVKSFAVYWESDTSQLALKVTKVGQGSHTVGLLEPGNTFVDWQRQGEQVVRVEAKTLSPPPLNPYLKPPPIPILNTNFEFIDHSARPRATIPSVPITVEKGKMRDRVFGYHTTAVLRWMGLDAWTFEDARKAMVSLGVTIADPTIKAQLHAGRTGTRGDPAALTTAQQELLYNAVKGVKPCPEANTPSNPTPKDKSGTGSRESPAAPPVKGKGKKLGR